MNNPIVYFLNTQGVFVLVFFVLIFLYFSEKKKEVFRHTLFVFITTVICTLFLKELFNTPRPYVVDKSIEAKAGLAFFPSFPSTHAAIAFSVATTVILHKKKLGMFLLILATLISLGRIAGRVHYPVDVGFGILLGVTIALFFDKFHIYSKFTKKKRLTS